MLNSVASAIILSCFSTAASDVVAMQPVKPVEIPNAPSCATCRVTVRTITTIGPRDGDGALEGQPFDVVVDPRNRYWVVPRNRPPAIYDSAGRFLRLLGRAGQGPGEYGAPSLIRFLGTDSVLAVDLSRRRGAVLTSDLTIRRTFDAAWPGVLGNFAMIGSMGFGSGYLFSPEAAGHPLHQLAFDGSPARITKSFGQSTSAGLPAVVAGSEYAFDWRLASGSNNTLWSADIIRYRLVQWSAAGSPLVEFVRKPVWFSGASVARVRGPDTPPDPRMRALAEDSNGLLWVAVLAASPTWKDAWNPRVRDAGRLTSSGNESPVRDLYDPLQMYMTRIEVIDPKTAKLVTSFSVNEQLVSMLPGRRAALFSESADGYPILQIVQFTLTGR